MAQETSTTDTQPEVNFEGLRNAITPINLMFDGRLCKDLKGLTGHITQAIKRVSREQPDYQGALIEINLLESAFNSAVMQWEQQITSEIQRLKNSVVSANTKSLGATKKISKFQEELTRGRASTRSMPIRIGQVRNQLLRASGHSTPNSAENADAARSRLSTKTHEFPEVYRNAASQITRKMEHRSPDQFIETALKILKNLSRPIRKLEDQELFAGKLYYLSDYSPSSPTEENDPAKTGMFQFAQIHGLNGPKNAYVLASIFEAGQDKFEIEFEAFNQLDVSIFEPLDDMEIIVQLLTAKFKEEDFKKTFQQYASIREKAIANNRDEKFNPKQNQIHVYLTDLIFGFIGIQLQNRASEVRFVEQINNALQLDKA